MTRADRLDALLSLLRAGDATTVAAIADSLAVTSRTVYRDLATLRDRGLPVVGETGRAGGIRLLGDRGITGIYFSVGEVVSLWLSARLAGAASQMPWSGAARSALTKLLGSLTKARAAELRRVLARVIIGPPPSDATQASLGETPPEFLRVLEEAFTTGCAMRFEYRDRNGRSSARRVEPHGVLVQSPVWYILSLDLDKGLPRTMRVDRIGRPQLLRSHRFAADPAVVHQQLGDLAGRCHALADGFL
jgi:predicted DNA-binding transcriptional regulator YafY